MRLLATIHIALKKRTADTLTDSEQNALTAGSAAQPRASYVSESILAGMEIFEFRNGPLPSAEVSAWNSQSHS